MYQGVHWELGVGKNQARIKLFSGKPRGSYFGHRLGLVSDVIHRFAEKARERLDVIAKVSGQVLFHCATLYITATSSSKPHLCIGQPRRRRIDPSSDSPCQLVVNVESDKLQISVSLNKRLESNAVTGNGEHAHFRLFRFERPAPVSSICLIVIGSQSAATNTGKLRKMHAVTARVRNPPSDSLLCLSRKCLLD